MLLPVEKLVAEPVIAFDPAEMVAIVPVALSA